MEKKYYVYVVVITLLLTGAAWWGTRSESEKNTEVLLRSEPGEGIREIDLEVEVPQLQETYTYQLALSERNYSEEERTKLFEAAKQEIEEGFLAEGEEFSHITKRVYLPNYVQDGLVSVAWSFRDDGIIEEDGSINAAGISEQGTHVLVCAELSYQEYQYLYEFPICVYPKEEPGKEDILAGLDNYFMEKEKQKESKEVPLPTQMQGYKLNWSPKNSHTPFIVLGLGILVIVLLPMYQKEQEDKRQQEKKRQLEADYAGMLMEFALLLGAGMTVRSVWERLVSTYERQLAKGKRKRSELYEQMKLTHRYIQDGAGEASAYEQFASSCGTACCRRFSMLLIQYLQKGTKGLAETLELEAKGAFEERKNLAKRQGEEAGTKLLLPMFLMLAVVIAIMLVPACMTIEL